MTRYGAMFGPDLTSLGVPAVDLAEPAGWTDADVVGLSHDPAGPLLEGR